MARALVTKASIRSWRRRFGIRHLDQSVWMARGGCCERYPFLSLAFGRPVNRALQPRFFLFEEAANFLINISSFAVAHSQSGTKFVIPVGNEIFCTPHARRKPILACELT